MELNADGTRVDVHIEGSMTTVQVDSLIVDLAMVRSDMNPEVPSNREDGNRH